MCNAVQTSQLTPEFQPAMLRGLFEHASDGMLLLDADARILEYTPRFLSIWDLPSPAESLTGAPVASLFSALRPLTARPVAFDAQTATLISPAGTAEALELLLTDRRRLRLRSIPLTDHAQRPLGWMLMARDITSTQLNLNDHYARYRIVFETTTDPVTITRLADGTYLDINQAFVDKTGYTRDEIIGRSALDVGIWAADSDGQRLIDKLANGAGHAEIHARFRRKG